MAPNSSTKITASPGVITEGKGIDTKSGKPKDNYTPGYELRAKVTVLAGR